MCDYNAKCKMGNYKGLVKAMKEKVKDWKERTFYLSGPQPMVETFEKMLKDMGLPNKQIKTDYFPGYS